MTEHVLEVLNGMGHLTLKWDPENAAEVGEAKELVDRLKKQGYVFYVAEKVEGDEVGRGAGTLLVERIADPTAEDVPSPAAAPPTPDLTVPKKQCEAVTQAGKPCRHKAVKGDRFCGIHRNKLDKTRRPPKKKEGRTMVAVRPLAGG
jgi:hypothetical protein